MNPANSGTPAAILNLDETPDQILSSPLRTSTEAAITASAPIAITDGGVLGTPFQLPTTPAELVATIVSAATSAAGSVVSGKAPGNTPLPDSALLASGSHDPQLQAPGENLFSRISAVFESLGSSSIQHAALEAGDLLREAGGKTSRFAAKPEIAPPGERLDSAVSRGSGVAANDLSILQGQRAISDARNSLAQQFQTKLESALAGPAPAAPSSSVASVAAAHDAANSASGQSNTRSNAENGNQRKSDDGANNVSATESSTAPVNADSNEALRGGGPLASATVPLIHGAPETSSQPASVAIAASLDLGTNATNSNSANTGKTAVPLPLALPPNQPAFSGDAVKASELYQRVDGSEMHVAMQTDLLGSVDLRATMHQSALTATISVQRSDVQALLSNELPALQHALADRNLHVEQINVLNNSVSDRSSANGQQHQQQNLNSAKTLSLSSARAGEALSSDDTPEPRISSADAARNVNLRSIRLSVHA